MSDRTCHIFLVIWRQNLELASTSDLLIPPFYTISSQINISPQIQPSTILTTILLRENPHTAPPCLLFFWRPPFGSNAMAPAIMTTHWSPLTFYGEAAFIHSVVATRCPPIGRHRSVRVARQPIVPSCVIGPLYNGL